MLRKADRDGGQPWVMSKRNYKSAVKKQCGERSAKFPQAISKAIKGRLLFSYHSDHARNDPHVTSVVLTALFAFKQYPLSFR